MGTWWFKVIDDKRGLAWHQCAGASRKFRAKRINTPGFAHSYECPKCGIGAALPTVLWWETKK